MSGDAKQYVLDLITRIDLEVDLGSDTCPATLILARALIAAAPLMPRMPTIDATVDAARRYLADPSEATHTAYVDAATASFPFGPGDGCLRVEETGVADCGVGSGCRSGSGTLAEIAYTVGYERLAAALKAALADPP